MLVFNGFCNDVQGEKGTIDPMAGDKQAITQTYTGRKFIGEGRGERRERDRDRGRETERDREAERQRKTKMGLLREAAGKEQEWAALVS